jgi:glycosyltransferase involved in cell wall biosynthesis
MGYPHEMALVRRVLLRLAERLSGFEFWLFGITPALRLEAEAYLEPLRKVGITCRTWGYMPYPEYLRVVAQSAVGLQPVCVAESPYSQGKSFGKVLAYLSGEVPVVASNAVDHPLFFRTGKNGFLVDRDEEWVESLALLLENPSLRDSIAAAAYEDFGSRLTTDAAAREMSKILKRAAQLDPAGRDSTMGSPVPRAWTPPGSAS